MGLLMIFLSRSPNRAQFYGRSSLKFGSLRFVIYTLLQVYTFLRCLEDVFWRYGALRTPSTQALFDY